MYAKCSSDVLECPGSSLEFPKFALFAKWESKRGPGEQYAPPPPLKTDIKVEKFCFSHSRAPRLKQISYRSTMVADNTFKYSIVPTL